MDLSLLFKEKTQDFMKKVALLEKETEVRNDSDMLDMETKDIIANLLSMTKEVNERLSDLEAREQALEKREKALALREQAFLQKQVSLTEKEMLFDNGDSEIIIDEDNAKLINSILNPDGQNQR